jgi:hypothetical protein
MMEMYDGVRVFWDGAKLHSKLTKETIKVPAEFNFPNTMFEGELW